MKEVITFLNNLLNEDDVLIVATSGGPDSMCLLHVLINNFKNKIICAHVNHGVRAESIKEAEYLKEYCKQNNIIFEYMEIKEYKNNKFSESEGRAKRYQFFKELKDKYQAKYILTAHHGGDLEETVLMRIVRGSNLKGYAGISLINNYLVRPLLFINKEDILNYNQKYHVKYFVDESNNNLNYTRNRYRKQVLPLLEKEDKMVHRKFLKYNIELNKYYEYIQKLIKEKINDIYVQGVILIDKLKLEDEFLQEKILEYVIADIQKKEILDIDYKHLQALLELIKSKQNKRINLKNGFIARVSYNKLIIEKNKDREISNTNYDYIFKKRIEINQQYIIELCDDKENKSNNIIRINSEQVTLPLHVRNMQNDDVMVVKNMQEAKKVKDIFKNAKVDIEERKSYPLVVDSKNVIIWVPGIKKSIFDKEIYEKYDIILKCTEENYE